MASRPELVAICKELKIDNSEMFIEDMEKAVRKKIDELYNKKKVMIGNIGKSETLLRFMNESYDYVFKDKDGNLVNYKGELK